MTGTANPRSARRRPPARQVCNHPGCPDLTEPAQSTCPAHKPAPWQHSTGHDRTRTAAWKRTVARVRRRGDDICYQCGASPTTNSDIKIEVDHIVAVSEHGTDDDANLATICRTCHRAKTAAEAAAARARRR